jgi:hypothetical protein
MTEILAPPEQSVEFFPTISWPLRELLKTAGSASKYL